jgi:hypothetical protein
MVSNQHERQEAVDHGLTRRGGLENRGAISSATKSPPVRHLRFERREDYLSAQRSIRSVVSRVGGQRMGLTVVSTFERMQSIRATGDRFMDHSGPGDE